MRYEEEIIEETMQMIHKSAKTFKIPKYLYESGMPEIRYDPYAKNSSFSASKSLITIISPEVSHYAEETGHFIRNLYDTNPKGGVIHEFFGGLNRLLNSDETELYLKSSSFSKFVDNLLCSPIWLISSEWRKAISLLDKLENENIYPSFDEIKLTNTEGSMKLFWTYTEYPYRIGYTLAQTFYDHNLVDERILSLIKEPSDEIIYNELLNVLGYNVDDKIESMHLS
ncbi:MAG: hypothetical protein K0B02_03485 [DPANN group archaeon]|nr:hypothetical protein [DPANN group archaeon]